MNDLTDHHISNFISYDHLNPTFRLFTLSLSSESIPRSYTEALLVPAWKQSMVRRRKLTSRGTWELISAPTAAIVVGYCWVFNLKNRPDGFADRYNARLVAKGYTQTYGIDYFEMFTPAARMNSIRILFSIVINLSCPFVTNGCEERLLIWGSSGGSLYRATSRSCCSGGD